ncbi:MAG: GNAT family N-acetyltransferase [Caldilineaceae bacterium]|nr:GNAT family N-acetyltransferase [Caldilineaceae bacterium]
MIRQAVLTDLPQLVALDQTLFGSYGAAESPAVIQARLAVFPAGCVVLVADATAAPASPLLGYLTTEKWATLREPALDEDPSVTHSPQGTILNITTLAIAPQHQNRQLGAQLLCYAINLAAQEGCPTIVLETAWAARFYARHHFVKTGERQQRGILLHIMRYDLPL